MHLNEFIMDVRLFMSDFIVLMNDSIIEFNMPGVSVPDAVLPVPVVTLMTEDDCALEETLDATEETFLTLGAEDFTTAGSGTPPGVQTPGTMPLVSDVHLRGGAQSLGE